MSVYGLKARKLQQRIIFQRKHLRGDYGILQISAAEHTVLWRNIQTANETSRDDLVSAVQPHNSLSYTRSNSRILQLKIRADQVSKSVVLTANRQLIRE